VSKTHDADRIRAAYAAGQRLFGESYAVELMRKQEALSDLPDLQFHFIGGIQSNKVKLVAGRVALVQSVDRVKLLPLIAQAAGQCGVRQPILLEVHLSPEESKGGALPGDLPALVESALSLPEIELAGLMTMPPYFDDPEQARPCFARLRGLKEELAARYALPAFHHLSMGMSHDFEVAIEEGATLVRVGTAIFGQRPRQAP
jgi:pyridoxal phosphate enzyme (YggS family)